MGMVIVKGEEAVFWGEFEASHCNQWGLLLYSCARVMHSSLITLGGLVITCH